MMVRRMWNQRLDFWNLKLCVGIILSNKCWLMIQECLWSWRSNTQTRFCQQSVRMRWETGFKWIKAIKRLTRWHNRFGQIVSVQEQGLHLNLGEDVFNFLVQEIPLLPAIHGISTWRLNPGFDRTNQFYFWMYRGGTQGYMGWAATSISWLCDHIFWPEEK